MSNHNYSKYSNKKYNKPESTTLEVKMESSETIDVIGPVFVEETVETVALPETVKGTVVGCMKLNIRVKPESTADVLCVVDANSELEINVAKSTTGWFHVNTAAGIDGYCMRKFVNAKL